MGVPFYGKEPICWFGAAFLLRFQRPGRRRTRVGRTVVRPFPDRRLYPNPKRCINAAFTRTIRIVGGRENSYGVGLPPLTLSVSPMTKLDSADARNTYAGASSAGWPARPRGVFLPNSGRASFGWPLLTCSGVQIGPGATALTRMPLGASCWARPLVKLLMLAFVVA